MHALDTAGDEKFEIAQAAAGPYFDEVKAPKKSKRQLPPLVYGNRIIPQEDPGHEVLAELSLIAKLVDQVREGVPTSVDSIIRLVEMTIHDIFEATGSQALFAAANPYLAQARNPDTMHEGLNGLIRDWIPEVEAHVQRVA